MTYLVTHHPRIYRLVIKAQGKAWGRCLIRQAKACHLPHTISVSRFCQKDGGEGLAARGLVEFVKVEHMIEERSSSVAYGATFPIVQGFTNFL